MKILIGSVGWLLIIVFFVIGIGLLFFEPGWESYRYDFEALAYALWVPVICLLGGWLLVGVSRRLDD